LGDLPFGQFHCLFALAFSIFQVCNFGRSNSASRNHSTIHRLLISLADLVLSFRAWHTGTLGGQMATWPLAKYTWRSPDSLFFLLLARFVPFCNLVSLLCSSNHNPENQGFNISYWHKISI
ncbi:hypothetical protein MTR67_047642, partial [Solanum verrucosum]